MSLRPPSAALAVVLMLLAHRGYCLNKTVHKTLHIGYLYTSENNYIQRAPALSLAIEDFQSRGGLPDYDFEIFPKGGARDTKVSTRRVVDLYTKHDVDVIFGPVVSSVCKSASNYLSYWDIPYITHGCLDPVLSNKNFYNTLVRVLPSYSKVGLAFASLFQHYGWTQVVLMIEDEGGTSACEYGADGIEEAFTQRNLTVAEWVRLPASGTGPMSRRNVDDYLHRAMDRGRVIILCRDIPTQEQFMTRAHALGMTNGDYVFLSYTIFPPVRNPWSIPPNATEEEIRSIQEPYNVFKVMTMQTLPLELFQERVNERALLPPWNFTQEQLSKTSHQLTLYLYDAVYLYLLLVNDTVNAGLDPTNKGDMFSKMARDKEFIGMTGTVRLDANSDREPDYVLWQSTPEHGDFHAASLVSSVKGVVEIEPAFWGTLDGKPPPDVPACGLKDEFCPPEGGDLITIVSCLISVAVIIAAAGSGCYIRQRRIEAEIRQMAWKVNYEDIAFGRGNEDKSAFSRSMRSLAAASRTSDVNAGSASSKTNVDASYSLALAVYKGTTVVVRTFKKESITLTKKDLIELNALREMSHENINPFLGACIDPPNICSLGQYCSKGTLQDILENGDIRLDWMFKKSIMSDLANGMGYLHNSQLRSHGRLKSSNCLVDSRWMLKITSFGLHAFRDGETQDLADYRRYWNMLWTPPEFLRVQSPPARGTQKGDVYSFGIILQELVFRTSPFFGDSSTPKEVIEKVRLGGDAPFRPLQCAHHEEVDKEHAGVLALMQESWAEKPESRPTFDEIRKKVRVINKGRKVNILDNMLRMLEKYANNLEEIVEQRTSELVEEKKRTDTLLYRMLPQVVAERLKTGKTVDAQMYDNVTIYFSDVVRFTELSSESNPMQVVDLLNDLYTMFDDIIAKHDVYKVETIGDAYMVVSGVPQPNGQRHVAEIANVSLDLLSEVTKFKIRHMPHKKLQLRIGMHTGPCAAGVVGLTMPRYCLFGDTVNVASRMESSGEACKIHVSQQARDALSVFKIYHLPLRGQLEVKGKGLQTTFWLTGKEEISATW